MTNQDAELLSFEREHPRSSLAKDLAIWGELRISATTYYERLGDLLDDPEAYSLEPRLVERLRRQRNVRLAFGLIDEAL